MERGRLKGEDLTRKNQNAPKWRQFVAAIYLFLLGSGAKL